MHEWDSIANNSSCFCHVTNVHSKETQFGANMLLRLQIHLHSLSAHHWKVIHNFKTEDFYGLWLVTACIENLKVAWWKACFYWLIGWKASNLHRNRGEQQLMRLRQTFAPHPSLSVPFNTRLWVPQWNISLHSIIKMNGLCSVSMSLMEFTESLLLLSFLLLHWRAANPIYFHS